ncbi:hypothetical protein GALMADRAFT_139109 [Galerina marginata CBS 339.88]|uniref:Peroxin-3 n=1 Tax=Galerina marginata (strain CBS 339.88) TaxID=685588 RepID=A0A067T432_GALM3|nr:hypothetical protein GALMADRAFT_139109 [Galerina marginata CBS 339.88]
MAEAPAKQSVLRSFTNGVVKTTCVIGGLYVVRGYMRNRLEEVREKLETEERAKDILRTRFLQTHENTSYTILALMPTLSAQVLSTMDVDSLTRELQARSAARNSRHLENARVAQSQAGYVNANINPTNASRPPSSLSSSIDLLSTSISGAPTTGSGFSSFTSASTSSYPPNPYPAPAPVFHPNPTGHEHDADSRSDLDSISHSSEADDAHSPATGVSSSFISDAGSVTRSWIVDSDGPSATSASVSASGASRAQERSRSPAVSAVSSMDHSESSSVDADGVHRMSESVVSINTTTTNTSAEGSEINLTDTRTKAELWNEVKMLTFTRTLTTVYASTLLCLLTTLQLTLLARGKYIAAILAQEKEERRQERLEARTGLANVGLEIGGMLMRTAAQRLGFGGNKEQDGGLGQLERLLAALEDDDDEEDDEFADEGFGGKHVLAGDQDEADHEEGWGLGWGPAAGQQKRASRPPRHGKGKAPAQSQSQTHGPAAVHGNMSSSVKGKGKSKATPWPGPVSEEAESKYLTMSWWLLHVGWKDVGERVRRGVEEVFDGVSLKTKLAAVDLHRLVGDVRRRVEHEITFEGNEKRTNFLSSLLPPTPETIHHVLTQGGYTPAAATGMSSLYPDPLGQFLDLGAGLDAETQSQSQSQSQFHSQQSQSQHPQHERMPSVSSTSLESSQLSYNFVNSPALAVSTVHPPLTQPPTQQQHQHTQAQNQTYVSVPPPQPPSPELLDAPFLALLDETRAILSSADFAVVLEACLDRATGVLFDGLEANVFSRQGTGSGTGEDERIRLAGLLPGLARWSQLALDGLPNELVDILLGMREVSCLSAIAFARFEERFSP